MEAIARAAAVAPSAACLAPRAEVGRSSSRACVSLASSRGNALSAKVPAHKATGSRRGVVSMAKESAASGYAAALLDVGKQLSVLEAIHTDLESLAVLTSSPEMALFLNNPVILEDKKKAVLKSLAAEAKLNPYTLNFLNLLVDKKRIGILSEIIAVFEEMYCEATDTQVAIVTSAVKLENSQQALIAKKLQSMTGAKNIKLKNVIDSSLIAGFIVKYGKDGSALIDMSVKGQLDRLADQLDLTDSPLVTA